MKILWMLMPLFLIGNIAAQDLIERKQAEDQQHLLKYRKAENALFSIDKSFKDNEDYGEVYLQLNHSHLKSLNNKVISQLAIPVSSTNYIDLILEPTEIYTSNSKVFDSDGNRIKRNRGNFYQGYIADDPHSRVTLSIFDTSVQLNISDSQGNYNLSSYEKNSNYVLFNDKKLGSQPFICKNDELNFEIPKKLKNSITESRNKSNECIKVYVEADFTTFTNFNSEPQKVLDFIEGAFLEVSNIYKKIGITIKLSDIKIWTSPDRYGADGNVSSALSKISNDVRQFNGDIMHLISATDHCCGWTGAAYVNYNSATGKFNGSTVCGSNPYGVSQTSLHYESLPVYSWTVNVMAHEIGHSLGAPHTHECIWGPNYDQSLDSCVPTSTTCGNPGIPSTGTIMSYCHSVANVGISLESGFHPVVAQHILAQNQNRSCLTPCTPVAGCTDINSHGFNPIASIEDGSCAGTCSDGIMNGDEEKVDCGGTLCAPCPIFCDGSLYYLELKFDRYAEETSWDITNFYGDIIYQGGPYVGHSEGSIEKIPLCLEDGEYIFTIYDSYGDGICCEYGPGSYTVYDDQAIMIFSGGDIAKAESTIFVVSPASCDDGIHNGDEEGVDCGGSCAPCQEVFCKDKLTVIDSVIWDFEKDNWDMMQDVEDDFDFRVMSGQTPSVASGPSGPAHGNNYIYLESSSPNYPSKTGRLIIECLDLREIDQAAMKFSYHMYGSKMGSLSVIAAAQNADLIDTLWSINGDQGNKWHRASLDLSLYQDNPIDIIFSGETGANFTSDIALDYIFIGSSNRETCYDGIQNGDEEAIDCGGSSCEPCRTCQQDDFTLSDNSNYLNAPNDIVVKHKIMSDGEVNINNGGEISWQAGESIEIGPGFEIHQGTAITMKTAACIESDN